MKKKGREGKVNGEGEVENKKSERKERRIGRGDTFYPFPFISLSICMINFRFLRFFFVWKKYLKIRDMTLEDY